MCGIIGYIGGKQATPVLIQGLRRLEYRGYDSAGLAVRDGNTITRVRSVGKIDMLAAVVKEQPLSGTMGIAHTRWATHGGVTKENAHPHQGKAGKIILVHNGIIENYREIKEKLGSTHTYESQTDSEILAHLIESHMPTTTEITMNSFRLGVETALAHVRGTYGITVMHADIPNCIIAARMGSPLVIGMGEGEHYIASDPTPILAYTKKMVFLEDGELAVITKEDVQTYTLSDESVKKCVEEIDWNDEQAEKQGFDHFMLKEIFDQPRVYEDAIRGRYNEEDGNAHLGGLNMSPQDMRSINRVMFIACGTASFSGVVGKYAFERLVGIPAEIEVASEFRYRDPIIDEHTLVFVISQSGETADTLAALREAKRRGAFVRGIVNVVGSTISRESDGGTFIHAGPELAVASTKAYTNMVATILLYAIQFGRTRKTSLATGQRLIHAMLEVPEKMTKILAQSDAIKEMVQRYKEDTDFFFLGRGVNVATALEGSLKLKEITYIHSEAYPGGELKHGALALIDEQFPAIAIMTKNSLYDKMRSNIEEVRARNGRVILIATEGDEQAKELADDIIYVPETMELVEPLLNHLPLQLFAYHMAVALGKDVDRPRNLAKSVTVE